MRVGRAALDEEAIRLIEQHNPDVEFDWTRILKGQMTESKPAPPSGRDRFEKGRRRFDPRPAAPPQQAAPPANNPPVQTMGTVRDDSVGASAELRPVEPLVDEVHQVEGTLVGIDGEPLQASPESISAEPVEDAPLTPAHARLGSEGVLRLRARHAELLARISERIQDPARQDELKGQAERLNPDTWVTDAEVMGGLEEYETIFETLRTAVGGPGRGRRNRPPRNGQPDPAARWTDDRKTENS